MPLTFLADRGNRHANQRRLSISLVLPDLLNGAPVHFLTNNYRTCSASTIRTLHRIEADVLTRKAAHAQAPKRAKQSASATTLLRVPRYSCKFS
jgi:hypothetical protein